MIWAWIFRPDTIDPVYSAWQLQCLSAVYSSGAAAVYSAWQLQCSSAQWLSLAVGFLDQFGGWAARGDRPDKIRQAVAWAHGKHRAGGQPGYSTTLDQTAFDVFRADSQLPAMQWTDRSVWTVSERGAVSHEGWTQFGCDA